MGNTYIIDFNINDFKDLAAGDSSFFTIIQRKKMTLRTNAKIHNFRIDHEKQEEIKNIVDSL